jgi:hypothetical protein
MEPWAVSPNTNAFGRKLGMNTRCAVGATGDLMGDADFRQQGLVCLCPL